MPGRQRHDAHLEALLLGKTHATQRRILSGLIRVEGQDQGRGKATQLGQLLLGQARAHRGDGLLYPHLVQCDHIGVALDDHRASSLRDWSTRMVQAVEQLALVEIRPLRRVDVLRPLNARQNATSEATHSSPSVKQREDDAATEAIDRSLTPLAGDTSGEQIGRCVALLERTVDDAIPGVGGKPDPPVLDQFGSELALGEIRACDLRFGAIEEHALVVGARLLEQSLDLLFAIEFFRLLMRQLLVLNRHAIALGQSFDGLGKFAGFELHHKFEDVATDTTAEAVVQLLCRLDREARRLLVVEWAASHRAWTDLAYLTGSRRHELDEVGALAHSLDCCPIDPSRHASPLEAPGVRLEARAIGAQGIAVRHASHVIQDPRLERVLRDRHLFRVFKEPDEE